MLQVCVTKFIVLTNDEVELWKDDSLKFFLHVKYSSNEVKGNLLRDKAKSLIAAIRLRFDPIFEEFCGILNQEIQETYSKDILSLQQ